MLSRLVRSLPQRQLNAAIGITARSLATTATSAGPWEERMPDAQFDFMRKVIAAPSPVGLESAMTRGVIQPEFESFMPAEWKIHRFKGSAGMVVDTHPGNTDNLPTVMVVGHCDKIRMQVRSVSSDGKIYIDSPSFLPLTLIGNEVEIFSESTETPGDYRVIRGGTVEALGAIHFANPSLRAGKEGIKPTQLYLELGIHGKKKKEQVTKHLGVRPGDSVLLSRPIKRSPAPNTFSGAYLDNGLGCFVTTELARLTAANKDLSKVRCLFTFAGFEEIGRFGSRVIAAEFKPDILIAVDVNHDYAAAPNVGDKRFPSIEMGEGFTISTGSVASPALNAMIARAAKTKGVPVQMDCVGADTGTDAMAGVLGNIDAAVASLGFPIRNMHTVSECGHTGDVLACVHGLEQLLQDLNAMESAGTVVEHLKATHPNLTDAEDVSLMLEQVAREAKDSSDDDDEEDKKEE